MSCASDFRPIPFAARRQRFLSELANGVENAVAIVPANVEAYRANDTNFKFRQDSNFFYLTGFDEPDAIAVFRNVRGKQEFVLFVRPKDPEKEVWDGYRAGVEGAVSKYGANAAYSVDQFDKEMLRLVEGADRVYYSFRRVPAMNGFETLDFKMLRLLDSHRVSLGRTGKGMAQLHDAHEILGEMRIIKAPEELDRMRRAATISAKAHLEAMCRTRAGLYESQIEGLIEFVFRNGGAERPGYNSIVAGGANSTILHYIDNDRRLEDGELLLIDAGAELDYYGADITRTFAVSGKMSREQRELYDVTLKVQKACVAMARPGVTLASIHQFAVEQLTDAMVSLKFLSGDRKKLVESLAYKRYYPHGTGHLLGMDVHDIGLYQKDGQPRQLEPGMVFTVEPGFYVQPHDTNVPERYRGIGIRIEDDVLITPGGSEVLTSGVTKEADEMEALVGSKPWLDF